MGFLHIILYLFPGLLTVRRCCDLSLVGTWGREGVKPSGCFLIMFKVDTKYRNSAQIFFFENFIYVYLQG